MFVLEYKKLYIAPEPMLKNRTHQTYRWKQHCMCEEKEPLQEFIDKQKRPDDWRIVPQAY